jgi:hypothetical protein
MGTVVVVVVYMAAYPVLKNMSLLVKVGKKAA